mmetsp:Transcript_8820/g.13080  ORF Transcript_8820/g.13080 Transcript_8820/m.13080 type:complete len:134 (+) Transcript_8820:508-909(+)
MGMIEKQKNLEMYKIKSPILSKEETRFGILPAEWMRHTIEQLEEKEKLNEFKGRIEGNKYIIEAIMDKNYDIKIEIIENEKEDQFQMVIESEQEEGIKQTINITKQIPMDIEKLEAIINENNNKITINIPLKI